MSCNFTAMTRIDTQTPIQQLEQLKIGDVISDNLGTYGEIKSIEVLKHKKSLTYYFRIKSGKLILALR